MIDLQSRELAQWLSYLEALNPSRIELGLDRVRTVLTRMLIDLTDVCIIEVAGTNGKGSSCALLDAALRASGYRCGRYTSPHLHRFNERICLNGRNVGDEELCAGFAAVYAAKGDIPLTYFEFTTLCAFYLFARAKLQFWVLEIGLGGRLDAVNVLDADIALITSIGLDHVHILGHTIPEIAAEKAGIIKPNKTVVCAELPPEAQHVMQDKAADVGAALYLQGRDFAATLNADSFSFTLRTGAGAPFSAHYPLSLVPAVCVPAVLCVLRLLVLRGYAITAAGIARALRSAVLPGRMQLVRRRPNIYLDVAHNVQAALHLSAQLRARPLKPGARRLAVIGMLKDKDIEGVLSVMAPLFTDFYVCSLPGERGEQASRLLQALSESVAADHLRAFATVTAALQTARAQAQEQDEIVICGSFVTAAAADDALAMS